MHTKTIITTTAGMLGSYNYTYGSRYQHGEDGLVFENKEMMDMYRSFCKPVWDNATPVKPQEPKNRNTKRPTEETGQTGGESKCGMD
jgi:phosphatidylserine/phosphatidylglycerophosphate/cardiolipin synthase-like enzyme